MILLMFVAAARAEEPSVALRIGYLKGTNDLTLAKAHGSLEKALEPRGVTVTWAGPFAASAPAVEAMNGGAIDLTVGSSTSFITSRAGGVKLVMFAYQPQSAGDEGIVVRTDLPLRSVAELAGSHGGGEQRRHRRIFAGARLEQGKRSGRPGHPRLSGTPRFRQRADRPSRRCLGDMGPVPISGAGKRQRKAVGGWRTIGSENAIAYFVSQSFLPAHRPVAAAVFDVLRRECLGTGT